MSNDISSIIIIALVLLIIFYTRMKSWRNNLKKKYNEIM